MRSEWFVVGSLALCGAGIAFGTGVERAAAADTTIAVEDFRFAPETHVVLPGDTVSFLNTGAASHNIVASDGSFNTSILHPGDRSFAIPIGSASVTYSCSLHENMTGTIIVQGAGSTTGPSASTAGSPTTVSAPTDSTAPTLAVTGTGSNVFAVVALILVIFGASLLVSSWRRAVPLPARLDSFAMLPRRTRDRARRETRRHPPAEF
jgi:plastocyanin